MAPTRSGAACVDQRPPSERRAHAEIAIDNGVTDGHLDHRAGVAHASAANISLFLSVLGTRIEHAEMASV